MARIRMTYATSARDIELLSKMVCSRPCSKQDSAKQTFADFQNEQGFRHGIGRHPRVFLRIFPTAHPLRSKAFRESNERKAFCADSGFGNFASDFTKRPRNSKLRSTNCRAHWNLN